MLYNVLLPNRCVALIEAFLVVLCNPVVIVVAAAMQAVVAFLSGNYTNSQFCQALAADAWKKLCQKATFFAGAADVAIQSHDINCRQIYPNLQNERKNI